MNPATSSQPAASVKWLWAAVGALGVSVLALGGTLLAQNLRGDASPAAQATAAALRTPESEIIDEKAPQGQAQQALAATDSRAVQSRRAPMPQADSYLQPAAQSRPAAPVCASCGRVESVQAIEQAAPATGLGAVAGGVLGGVLGNQIGKGSGRTAATVLGAVGGGYVGHKVEERTRTTTVYQMRVRMQDGSVRSFTRSQPVAEGTPVRVQGKGFRVDDGSGDADRAGTQPVRVVDRGY
ncbi:glycine zipper 2TM domain-containing protein [Alicycliphilus denitrificans]|uniref:17 kDa surface antigen n=1 Tax=Alicycliphilus denitrificans (strain DSM 14773 / CIP 107495 / K601) TaxID=596154 RepID=F4GEC6_ALIDK|nr:glycine zipper 2TM domain-containing protein [Alicycliphilus denitrificans]ADU98041.1 17 kDa surface antigen [Alicycliphilus denitrificans BC]AEB82641.1 17 kDa surface antigen [Alicycliphilus denitrificans K601]GAO21608.1 17 kDa surface antigen [Alicycliphilus sp. B1]GAO25934.1 surface antigen [Alicycliphilus sp. B1]